MSDTIEVGSFQVARDTVTRVLRGDSLKINRLASGGYLLIDSPVTILDGDDGSVDGLITLTQDVEVTATGELTLDVTKVGDVRGTGRKINVAVGGKIKLAHGKEVTVLPGTKYTLHTGN